MRESYTLLFGGGRGGGLFPADLLMARWTGLDLRGPVPKGLLAEVLFSPVQSQAFGKMV